MVAMFNELINKFTETIFFKKGTELEEQIKALKNLLEKYPNNEICNKNKR